MDNPIKEKKSAFTLILVISSFLLTILAIVSGTRMQSGYLIEVGNISKERYSAPRDIENSIATEKLRQDAYKSLKPTYRNDLDVPQNVLIKLSEFYDNLETLRAEYQTNINKIATIDEDLVAINADEDLLTINSKKSEKAKLELKQKNILQDENITTYLPEKYKQLILEIDDKEFENLKLNTNDIIKNVYEIGVKEDDSLDSTISNIKNELNLIYTDLSMENLAVVLIKSFLEPSIFIDHDATEKARQLKASEVEPEKYLKGETIVDIGQKITEEIYAVLSDLGIIQNDYGDVFKLSIGATIITIIIYLIIFSFLKLFPVKNLKNSKEKLMLFTIYITCVSFIWAVGISINQDQFLIPVLVFVLLIAILHDINLAIIMNICFSSLVFFIAKVDFNLFIYFILAGSVLALNSKLVLERNKIIIIAIFIGATNTFIMIGINLYSMITDANLFVNSVLVFVNGFISVIIAIGSLPVWEVMFGAVTTIKLLDLTNPNHELLSRLTIEAPGTYHHSLIVANLAESAAKDIGANPVLVRVGAYYHDVGKLKYPLNFSENIVGENPHNGMDPYESAEVIKSHVSYGLELANKHKLPQDIKDMIEMHHGNTVISYFYDKAKKSKKYKDVQESDFRYPYKTPSNKEVAIVMLADTTEAAVRSIINKVSSLDEVEQFVKKLIDSKLQDNQLQESLLTIKDLNTIAKSFMKVFEGMYHARITYPENNEEKETAQKAEDYKTEKILFENETEFIITDDNKKMINDLVIKTLEEESLHSNVEVSVLIVSDDEIKELNNKHRNIDEITDVLSFPLIEKSELKTEFEKPETVYLGDIVIDATQAEKQAEEYGHTFERELAFLTTHSILHLLGYDHENEEDESIMISKQESILNNMGIIR